MPKLLLMPLTIVVGSLGGIAWGHYVIQLPWRDLGVCSAIGAFVSVILLVFFVHKTHSTQPPTPTKRLPAGKDLAERLRSRSFESRLASYMQRVVTPELIPKSSSEQLHITSPLPCWSAIYVRRRQSLKSPLKIRKILQRIHNAWQES
jgi:hypothetical protein